MNKPTTLRDGPFAFLDLLEATTSGTTRFRLDSQGIRYGCLVCDATFEQTGDGHRLLREHELEHGRANCVDLSEIDGKILRIVTWAASGRYTKTPEIWGVDDEHGVVYYLSNAYQADTVWKWRIRAGESGVLALLNAATPLDPV